MKLYGVEIPKGEVPKRFLQKAYLQYSTQSTVKSSSSEPNPRSHWQHQISSEQKLHSEILHKIQSGERVDGIEKDPLASVEPDIVMDYSAIPGFLQREKSTTGEDKLRVKPSHESIKQVEKFMQKFKE